ncbi:MAG: PadR family transcriptional regulator [Spirochaetia bacterium]|jgi:DNA-binding PadR family transcriptional regulator|nr:PadR family transcriptional regulator [Spirochaetia bacterium]
MSAIDLMLLGSLIDHPMNAYELKKQMEIARVSNWVKISSPAVYKNLVQLAGRGYLDTKVVKEGEMPEKTIYSVNGKGQKHFQALMETYSQKPGFVYIDFTAFISNLHHLEKPVAEQMLHDLQGKLYVKLKYMELVLEQEGGKSNEAKAIITLYVRMYELFYRWACDFHLDQ